jgi:hypothetical protein
MKSELQRQQGRHFGITEKQLIREKIHWQEIRSRILKTGKTKNLNQTLQNKCKGLTGKFFLSTRVEI